MLYICICIIYIYTYRERDIDIHTYMYTSPSGLLRATWSDLERASPTPADARIRRRENMVGVNMVLAEYHQDTLK